MMRYLSWVVLSATLTFATLILPVSAQNSTLTPELLSKMLDYIAREGVDRDIPASIANRMGLGTPGKDWPSRQMVFKETTTGYIHSVSISRGSDKDILLNVLFFNLIKNETGMINVWRIRRDGTLVAAIGYDARTKQFTTLDRAAGQKKLEAEIFYWNRIKLSE